MKLFSFVKIYNQAQFEKELDTSLNEPSKNKEEEIEFFQKSSSTPSIIPPVNDDVQINNSEFLIPINTEKEDEKLNYQDFYSFKTFKELYFNVKLLITSSKSKEDQLKHH